MCSDSTETTDGISSDTYKNILSDHKVKWQAILTCSEQLLQLAYQKNWPALIELHKQRDDLLDTFFRNAIAEGLIDKIKEDILIIKERDEEIVRLVKNNQQQLGDESQQLLAMKKRINSYLSAGGEKL
ncbi:MAG: flagellar protein FliT [Pseudohongiella sp.]|nr:flagellar protein FliT [Pseudohongiella sp.]